MATATDTPAHDQPQPPAHSLAEMAERLRDVDRRLGGGTDSSDRYHPGVYADLRRGVSAVLLIAEAREDHSDEMEAIAWLAETLRARCEELGKIRDEIEDLARKRQPAAA